MENKKKMERRINQSNELYLIEDEDLKRLLDRNPNLKKEVEETEKLINTKLKIKTIEEFDEIVGKIKKLELKIKQLEKEGDYRCVIDKMQQATNQEDIEQYLNEIKFHHYNVVLKVFLDDVFFSKNDIYKNRDDADFKQLDLLCIDFNFSMPTENVAVSQNIMNGSHAKFWSNYQQECKMSQIDFLAKNLIGHYFKFAVMLFVNKSKRDFMRNQSLISLLKVNDTNYLKMIRNIMIMHIYISTPKILLALLSNPDRYNFFLQWHKMLEKNLPDEDKQLFRDYLDSCKDKLQSERNKYSYFYQREWVLTGIFIFGIIASAVVLTIYFLEMYAATWFFWFGIVGVVLTVAVGIRLGYFLLKNYNRFKSIDRAIDVYDLNKIRDFKEPEPEKISTIETKKNKIISSDNEINTTEQDNNSIQLEPIDTEENRNDP